MASQLVCRKKYRTISLVFVVIVLFYLLQCISVTKLGSIIGNSHMHRVENDLIEPEHKTEEISKQKQTEEVLLKSKTMKINPSSNQNGLKKSVSDIDTVGKESKSGIKIKTKLKKEKFGNPIKSAVNKSLMIRGLLPEHYHMYKPNARGKFTCIKSTNVRLPFILILCPFLSFF